MHRRLHHRKRDKKIALRKKKLSIGEAHRDIDQTALYQLMTSSAATNFSSISYLITRILVFFKVEWYDQLSSINSHLVLVISYRTAIFFFFVHYSTPFRGGSEFVSLPLFCLDAVTVSS